MNVHNLIVDYKNNNPRGHFFDRETLKFFGERESEMRVLKRTVVITDSTGDVHECYVLSSLQRKAPGGPKRAYFYFDTNSFKEVMYQD